ncbi:MAG TPA: FAD-dependent oxidoreductase [Candidatus Binataceae bacterium]|nr:FAD-dependent oxidoreductase [Candidatus Binataceae bacterium]
MPEVIVVGAGIVGCSLAFHLARAGVRVTVFDKDREVCAGMTARSGALLRMHYTFAPEAELAWKSLGYFAHWEEMVGRDAAGRGCGFAKTGFTIVVGPPNAEKLRANVAMLRAVGIDTVLVEPAELLSLEPAINVDDVALAAYEPQSGYADPVAATRSMAEAAARHGATFKLGVPIASIDAAGARARGVVDAAGTRYEAGTVCVVAGPWTDRLLKPLGAPIGIRAERAQIAFFKRPATLRHGGCIDTISGSYFRPHGDAETLIGLGDLKAEYEPDPDSFREDNDADFVTEVAERLAHRVPAMAGAGYSRGHAGIYDISPDSRAVMGPVPEVGGLYVAAGFSGTGFKTAPAVGAAMAELILTGRSTTVDLRPFGFARLREGRPIRGEHEYLMGANFGHKL